MDSRLPSGTVTFLFTEVEDSGQLWEEHPDAMGLALARHDARLRSAFELNHGYLFRTEASSVRAAFATPAEGVAAALAAQQTLRSTRWGEVGELRVRMGMHTGPAHERGGEYTGSTPHRTARLLALGHGGQVLLSAATESLVRDQLPPSASLADLGLHLLPELSVTERIFQLLHPDLPSEFPPLRSPDERPNNLPQQVTRFIGRETEMARLAELLARDRLVTLTGPGGIGKSRLCLQAATGLLDQYPDGVWLVELAPLSEPRQVAGAAAAVLGVQEEAGRPILRTLTERLRPKKMLILLDNCEHLVAASSELVDALLKGCPNIRIVASSREALNIAGETTLALRPLRLPSEEDDLAPEKLRRSEAVQLFTDRASAVAVTFEVTHENAGTVARVCRRLEGIPLAIELAAARVRSLPVEKIAERLDDRFSLLTGGSRAALPRQQTLRALIDWSYDLLTDQERLLLQRLSTFAAGWTIEAAEKVAAGDGLEEREILDLLSALVDKSLVQFDEQDEEARYQLLETVREYARGRLSEDALGAARARHAQYFMQMADEGRPLLEGHGARAWLVRLGVEYDNLRQAMECLLSMGDANGALRMGTALMRFWQVHGYFREGRRMLTQALELRGEEGASVRAFALNSLGNLDLSFGELGNAGRAYEEALAIFRRLEDCRQTATMLNNMGLIHNQKGEFAEARALFEEALAINRELGNRQGQALNVDNLGVVATGEGNFQQALALLEEGLKLRRELGDERSLAGILQNYAIALRLVGDLDRSESLTREALELNRRLHNRYWEAYSLNVLAQITAERGQFYAAGSIFRSSVRIWMELEDRTDVLWAFEGLARAAALMRGRGVATAEQMLVAARLLGAAAAIREMIEAPINPGYAPEHSATVAVIREALGEVLYQSALDEGRQMPLEDAAALALADWLGDEV